ncbi:MAG: hypothetical protein CMH26_03825 [Micavibrio sp.]|nr:hypothetical protein [Micavibrio sp.]|tara:strand:- start:3808 stop:4587 length:780 start_codon:yes stop_codon:yes gene_type:complete
MVNIIGSFALKKIYKTILTVTALSAFTMALPSPAPAQVIKGFELKHSQNYNRRAPGLKKPGENQVVIFSEEPFFKKVTMMKLDPPLSVRERVDRLLYGINTDVPPEYDHYGYEIRRYMSTVGNPKGITDPQYLETQLKNIKSALIILEYWGKALEKEIDEIEAVIQERGDTGSTRSTFRYNRALVKAFLVETRSWIENNRMLLEMLQDLGPKGYSYNEENGYIGFLNKEDLQQFVAIYESKMKALRQMRDYLPFQMMIY